jgi:hypothetical protein
MNEVIFLLEKDNACQTNYFDGIVNILNQHISDYSIIITADFKYLPTSLYKKIVILAAEDGMRDKMPYIDYHDVVAVFRFYGFEWGYDNEYVFPIPIGYNCRTDGYAMVRMYPEKKLSERKYDIFYSGQSFPWRNELVRRLEELGATFNIYSQVNPAFRTGLNIDDYYKCLGDAKICVIPDGASTDTFRYVEACGSGCAIITTYKPYLWYYLNAPVVYINNWGELTKSLLEDVLHRDLVTMQNNILKYYNECLSEEAVANYMLKCLKL